MKAKKPQFIVHGLVLIGGIALGMAGLANARGQEDMDDVDQIGEVHGAPMCHAPELYTPKPNDGAKAQIVDLIKHGQFADALLIYKMIKTPQAVWFTQGTPSEVQHDVHVVVSRARNQGTPVLVPYNIPFRDCAQFSAGGATNAAEYAAWIDGFAKGIGNSPAIVILEPDSIGIIPWFAPYFPQDPNDPEEWCRPAEANRATAANERFAMLNAAIARIKQQPNVKLYLDATNAAWLGVGEVTHRLLLAGVAQTDGFYINASNYFTTTNTTHYGNWISSCLALTQTFSWWDASWCAGQYAPDANGVWVATYTPEHIADVYAAYSAQPPAPATTHFVVDTSRNGVGDWTPPADRPNPSADPQVWCNPPNRGLGLRPTLNTGVPLVDAYLWIKIPGESDGQCNRWNPAGGIDPVRNMMDPAAGKWFPEMALELVHNAVPAL